MNDYRVEEQGRVCSLRAEGMTKKKFKIPEQPRAVEVNGDVRIDMNRLNQWQSDMDAAHKEFMQMMQGAKDLEEMFTCLLKAMK